MPLDSHCISPSHSQSQLPKQWSIYTSLGFPGNHLQEKLGFKNLLRNSFFLFLSPPLSTTAQTRNYENQPFKYEWKYVFSSDIHKQVFSFMNLQESFHSSIQRRQIMICVQCSHQPQCDKATEEGDHSKASELTLNCMTMMLKKCSQLQRWGFYVTEN